MPGMFLFLFSFIHLCFGLIVSWHMVSWRIFSDVSSVTVSHMTGVCVRVTGVGCDVTGECLFGL